MLSVRPHVLLLACLLLPIADGVNTPSHVRAGNAQARPGVAVLEDGRVFRGVISEVPGGYRVQHANGASVVLPFEQVRATASSLEEAYETIRDNMRKPTADDHLTLAEWCVENRLLSAAENELVKALRLEPLRQEARDLLRKIDQQRPPTAAAAPGVIPQPATAMSIQSFTGREERVSTGVTRAAQQEFVSHVQPLLMNKCANAGCHAAGNSRSRFQLSPVRLSSSNLRNATQHNLDVVLRYLDLHQPAQSPLLIKPGENSAAHQGLFLSGRSEKQYQLLENWIVRVSRESPDAAPQTVQAAPAENTVMPLSPEPARMPHPDGPIIPVAARQTESPAANDGTDRLDQLRAADQYDAFDPERFNRLVHGSGPDADENEPAAAP